MDSGDPDDRPEAENLQRKQRLSSVLEGTEYAAEPIFQEMKPWVQFHRTK